MRVLESLSKFPSPASVDITGDGRNEKAESRFRALHRSLRLHQWNERTEFARLLRGLIDALENVGAIEEGIERGEIKHLSSAFREG